MYPKVIKKASALTTVLIMCFAMIAPPLLAQTDMDEYHQGRMDGEAAAQGNSMWFFAGCLMGMTGILIAYIVEPSPPGEYLVGKSMMYIQGFKEAYAEKAKEENAKYAVKGCAATVVATAAVYAVLLVILIEEEN